ncbi:MGH1-like glycoside hydrolase domain-containing protein [Microbulbifer spongiae]|uniref:TIM barrel protein n=1 Tax=Microbulbifer spongiae TaxID=2944933 RepID=A0ABY9EG53_9GAMM|nr:trehalase family glycosidase [Microbulbifer sp. MI-G]WKD51272.1 TIM barrel protein [Microbulbifer sp. MI-G]
MRMITLCLLTFFYTGTLAANPPSKETLRSPDLPVIGIQLWSVREDLNRDFEGTLSALADMGFAAVEFAGEFGPYAGRGPELRSLLDQLGLKVSGAHIGFNDVTADTIEQTAGFYRELGAEYLIVGWDTRGWDTVGINALVTDLNRTHRQLEARGLRFGYHNHAGELSPFRDATFWDHIATNTSDTLVLQQDVGWTTAAGDDPVARVMQYPGRTLTTHYKAHCPDDIPNARSIIGEDVIDWLSLIHANVSKGGTRWIILEQETYPDGMRPLAAVRASKVGLDHYLAIYRTRLENGGHFFPTEPYRPKPLPVFSQVRDQLPRPVFARRPDYIEFYYRAWEIGFGHFTQPVTGSPLVKNFIDEAFNENIFLWDMSFSTMWGNYAHHLFPAIEGLDNFYALQMPNGEIVREIGESNGRLGVKGWSEPGTPGNLNHPMLAWAELRAYRITADRTRLARIYPALRAYRESYQQIYHPATGLYLTDKAAMDDSPRNDTLLAGVDVSAQMAIFDRWLAEMADILEKPSEALFYLRRAARYSEFLNKKLWDAQSGFYYDWGKNGKRMTMRTIAAFWPMLGGISSATQVERLIRHLNDEKSFKTAHRVPTHPKDEAGYSGDYWAGAVWAPTNTMVISGLEKYGHRDLAHEIALNHLNATTEVYKQTGTAWENYFPEKPLRGRKAKPDFIGWSGLAPITYLIEYAIGIRIDAPNNTIHWWPRELGRHGIENLRYRTASGRWNKISLVAAARKHSDAALRFSATCEQSFNLVLHGKSGTEKHTIHCTHL